MIELLKAEPWREREDGPAPTRKRGGGELWKGELEGKTYRLIQRAGARVWQVWDRGELAHDERWKEVTTREAEQLIIAAYTGVPRKRKGE